MAWLGLSRRTHRRHPEVRALARLEGWPQAPLFPSFEARRRRRAPQDDISTSTLKQISELQQRAHATHLGPLRTPKGEIAATGKAFRVRMMASFEFAPDSAKIVCERPYFDQRAVIRALGLS
jgi:hypothetical protein